MMVGAVNRAGFNPYTNQINKTQNQNKSAAQKLATGRKVNSAADNTSAMAISEKMLKQINSLSQGSQNIQSGIQMTQIADGVMQSVSDEISDLETNAIRAMNGTMSADDKEILQQSAKASIDTIAHVTNLADYNGKKLLDGSAKQTNIYTGTESEMFGSPNLRAQMMGLKDFSLTGDKVDLDTLNQALKDVTGARSAMGAKANGLSSEDKINQISIENTTAAESRMMDTEYGKATGDLKKTENLEGIQNYMLKKKMEQKASVTTNLF